MSLNIRKVLSIVAVIVIIALAAFLLYWFLIRKTEEEVKHELVKFDVGIMKYMSIRGDQLPASIRNECGQHFMFNQSATGDFIAPGGTFPWVAAFGYSSKNGEIHPCGGVVINERYILTAAHCLYGIEKQELKLEKIRLGLTDDHNSTNCDATGDCGQAVWVGIEEIIPHNEYNPKSKVFLNDIALIRVNQDIKFTKFIKPICLRDKTELGGKKYLAGWSKNLKDNGKLNPKKHVLVLQYSPSDKCNEFYQNHYSVPIVNTQICVSGEETETNCIRNSGNALATLSNDRWYAEGIDSFGTQCNESHQSMGIFTEVAHFYEWIRQTIRK